MDACIHKSLSSGAVSMDLEDNANICARGVHGKNRKIERTVGGYYVAAHADEETKAELLPKWDFLTTATILYENPVNDINFSISSRMAQEEWDAYIDEIKKLSRMEPAPKLYVLLPNATEVPFTVSISSHGDARHYVIRLLDGVS